jgi:hypothetical protein
MTPLQVELANVEWEIFLIYKSGFAAPEKLASLWVEVDRLDALVVLDG